jgi:hypothetical protein
MSGVSRHRINAVICVLVLAHAVYRFFMTDLEPGFNLRTGLIVAQGLLGIGGAVWFWSRSRGIA